MTQKVSKFSKFWLEVKRRKTDRVIVAYAATSFVILQLAEIFKSALSLPFWFSTFIIIVLAIGFPISAVFSWFFDITPGGIEKTRPASERKKQKIEAQLRTWKETTLISVIVIIALLLFNIISNRIEANEIRSTDKSIAVLPFEALSPDEDLPYYCDGMTTIMITGLSEIKEFSVLPRSVVLEYKNRKKSIPEIAKKLKVFFILKGELVKSGNQILVSVNLFIAKKEKVIFSKNYSIRQDEYLDKIHEIINQVTSSLKTIPTDEEKRKINNKPTRSGIAYMNYMKASASQDNANSVFFYLSKGDSIFKDLSVSESFNRALEFYDKAIAADSSFALAYAKRAITRSWGYYTGNITSADQVVRCRDDIEHAMKIDKDLIEAQVAYGFYYYYFLKDYNKALEYFGKASVREPYNWEHKYYMMLVQRAIGDWKQSQKLIEELGKSNIQDPLFLTNIGLSYQSLHQFDSAIYYHDRAIEIMPKWSAPYHNKIEALILRDGTTHEAEVVIDSAVLRTSGGQFPKFKIIFDLYNGKFVEALLKAENTDLAAFNDQGDKYLVFAEIYRNLNETKYAAQYYSSALDFFTSSLKKEPENTDFLGLVGISYAGLNNRQKAIDAGQKAISLAEHNYREKKDRIKDLAQIYVMLGEYNKSIPLLEELLGNPSDFSVKLLQLDPVWQPLQNIPEFRELITYYSKK